jgi:hypothetical protein
MKIVKKRQIISKIISYFLNFNLKIFKIFQVKENILKKNYMRLKNILNENFII